MSRTLRQHRDPRLLPLLGGIDESGTRQARQALARDDLSTGLLRQPLRHGSKVRHQKRNSTDGRRRAHPARLRAHLRALVDYGVERTIAQISLFLITVEIGEAEMPTDESLIDEIIKACNGDLRAAIKSVLVINEQRRAELKWLREAANKRSRRATDSGPVIH